MTNDGIGTFVIRASSFTSAARLAASTLLNAPCAIGKEDRFMNPSFRERIVRLICVNGTEKPNKTNETRESIQPSAQAPPRSQKSTGGTASPTDSRATRLGPSAHAKNRPLLAGRAAGKQAIGCKSFTISWHFGGLHPAATQAE
jgi:hypothetical protein